MPPQDPDSARWFAEHLQVHDALLRSWLQTRFPAIDDLDDIIQDAYLRVLQAHAKREIRQPKAFLFATARNLAYNHYHKYHLRVTDPIGNLDDFPVLDETADITETICRNQELELMTQAIQSLPDRCRQVLTLRNVYGLSYKEIAQELSMALKTVEAHMAKGVERCIDYVEQYRG
jgi:RNA polymerase sigma factor (sigma-70 family)